MAYSELDCAVVVSSCDAFSDAWGPFFTLFFRYWPDCPFPIYLISNAETYPDSRVRPLLIGPDQGWANNTETALERLKLPYILWMLEDLLLEQPVDTAYIRRLFEEMKARHVATIRLFPSPPPDDTISEDLALGSIHISSPYRVSLLAGLWDTSVFLGLMQRGENAWQMEIQGTERSRKIARPFLSVQRPALHFLERTAIVRGQWMYQAVQLCRREKVSIDFSRRSIAWSRYWLGQMDIVRKRPWARWLRSLPVIGGLGSWLTMKMRTLFQPSK